MNHRMFFVLALLIAQPVLAQTELPSRAIINPPTANADNPATPDIDESLIPLDDLDKIQVFVEDAAENLVAGPLDMSVTDPTGGAQLEVPIPPLAAGDYRAFARSVSLSGARSEPFGPFLFTIPEAQPIPGSPLIIEIRLSVSAPAGSEVTVETDVTEQP